MGQEPRNVRELTVIALPVGEIPAQKGDNSRSGMSETPL